VRDRLVVVCAGLLVAAMLVGGCSAAVPDATPTPARAEPTPSATASAVLTVAPIIPTEMVPAATPTANAIATATATPSPRPSSTDGANVTVNSPQPNSEVGNPLHVAGRARAFEAMLVVELVVDDVSLARQPVHASMGAPEWGDYAADLKFAAPAAAANATLRAYTLSPKDGSVRDLVEVPVRLRAGEPTATPTSADRYPLQLYFPRESGNELVFAAVTREVPRTPAIGRVALDELLRGPTTFEQSQGLSSPFPPGARVKGLRIENGTAYVDFDAGFGPVSGSERIRAVSRSVELTLRQFSTVSKVDITVAGSHDWAQP
jgi:hypothetical protein